MLSENSTRAWMTDLTKLALAHGHYFHQDLLIAQKILRAGPEKHIDIGSRIDGFVAHVATFREIEIFDIRNISARIRNIKFTRADIMARLDERYIDYCDSLSCLHALEHFGLGRYGDPIEYDGHLRGLENLFLMLRKGGRLYLSVPIGPQRIEFNAHRVFSVGYLLNLFEPRFSVVSFSYVDDDGDLHEDELLDFNEIRNDFNCIYGCGIFELTKL